MSGGRTDPRVYAAACALANALHDDAVEHGDTDLEAALGWMSSDRLVKVVEKVLAAADPGKERP